MNQKLQKMKQRTQGIPL